MAFLEKCSKIWSDVCVKAKPVMQKVQTGCAAVMRVLRIVWQYIVKLRKIILSVPVIWGALSLAMKNMQELPEYVGLDLQPDGTFAMQIGRFPAVALPLLATLACLFLMFISRRTLTPWLVSVFSLALPVIILVINIFPA